jgi:hypothetical protein
MVNLKAVNLMVVMVVVVVMAVNAQFPPSIFPGAGGGGPPGPQPTSYPGVTSSHCLYLVGAPSPWGVNAAPFKLYTRSYSGEVRKGTPVEGRNFISLFVLFYLILFHFTLFHLEKFYSF